MNRILVLYSSSDDHLEMLARALADGACHAGGHATVKRLPELLAADTARRLGAEREEPTPVAQARELPDYDAIVFGTPMRHGRLATQLANFMDRSDEISTRGALVGKVGSVFCSPADQLDAPETTLTAFYTNLLHHGMVVVGLPYAAAWLLPQGEIRDAGEPQRERRRNEFELARFQGRHVAEIVARLAAHSGGREPVGFHAAVPWL